MVSDGEGLGGLGAPATALHSFDSAIASSDTPAARRAASDAADPERRAPREAVAIGGPHATYPQLIKNSILSA